MEELDVRVAFFADILSFQTPDCSKLYPGTTSVSMVSRVFIRETSRGNRIFIWSRPPPHSKFEAQPRECPIIAWNAAET